MKRKYTVAAFALSFLLTSSVFAQFSEGRRDLRREIVGMLVGRWLMENLTDGKERILEINADGTFSRNGNRIGTWELEKLKLRKWQIIFHFDNRPGDMDRYDLFLARGRLEGTNKANQKLILTRAPRPR